MNLAIQDDAGVYQSRLHFDQLTSGQLAEIEDAFTSAMEEQYQILLGLNTMTAALESTLAAARTNRKAQEKVAQMVAGIEDLFGRIDAVIFKEAEDCFQRVSHQLRLLDDHTAATRQKTRLLSDFVSKAMRSLSSDPEPEEFNSERLQELINRVAPKIAPGPSVVTPWTSLAGKQPLPANRLNESTDQFLQFLRSFWQRDEFITSEPAPCLAGEHNDSEGTARFLARLRNSWLQAEQTRPEVAQDPELEAVELDKKRAMFLQMLRARWND